MFPIVRSCILDIESCHLKVHIISTDNYPLNVSLFKQFSLNTRLETHVPHPSCDRRKLFLYLIFVHILKSVQNNWLNEKDFIEPFTSLTLKLSVEFLMKIIFKFYQRL